MATDFQPALRFVPGLRRGVVLTLKDAALAGTRVDSCTPTGGDSPPARPTWRGGQDAPDE